MRRFFVVPATFALGVCGVSTVNAAENEIYELITTALHVRSSATALPVTVLANDDLHAAAKATLGDTLASQPGINNASFGPAVGQVVIRGQSGRRVMNLTNSMSNADASGNSADHAMTVEAILADAIEVLRGPSTLLYGGGAIGGVVNVIDRRIATSLPQEAAFTVETRHATAADLNTVVGSLDVPTGNLVWHFDALQRHWNDLEIPAFAVDRAYLQPGQVVPTQAGHIPNSAGSTNNWTAGSSWVNSNGYFGLAVSRLDNNYGLPVGAQAIFEEALAEEPEEEDVAIAMERSRYDLQTQWHELQPWLETLNYKLSYTDYEHAEIEGPGIVGTRFSNESWQQRLQITLTEMAGWHGVLGLQDSMEEFGAVGLESFIPVSDIDSRGFFVVEDYHFPAVTLEFGARGNRDVYRPQHGAAPSRDFANTSFSASALWDVSEPITLGLALSASERAPSIEELYSNFGLTSTADCVIHLATSSCEIGSPDFKQESSLNTDFSVALGYEKFATTFTVFYNDFADYIGQITTGAQVQGRPVRLYQQLDASFAGIEIDTNLQINDVASLRLFGDVMRGKFADAGAVPRMPPPARVGLDLNLEGSQWTAFLSLQHAVKQDKPGYFELVTNAYTRIDAGVDFTFTTGAGEVLVFVKGLNLGNTEIRLATSYLRGFAPEAGRSLEVGVRYRL